MEYTDSPRDPQPSPECHVTVLAACRKQAAESGLTNHTARFDLATETKQSPWASHRPTRALILPLPGLHPAAETLNRCAGRGCRRSLVIFPCRKTRAPQQRCDRERQAPAPKSGAGASSAICLPRCVELPLPAATAGIARLNAEMNNGGLRPPSVPRRDRAADW